MTQPDPIQLLFKLKQNAQGAPASYSFHRKWRAIAVGAVSVDALMSIRRKGGERGETIVAIFSLDITALWCQVTLQFAENRTKAVLISVDLDLTPSAN